MSKRGIQLGVAMCGVLAASSARADGIHAVASQPEQLPRFGMMTDAGVPDGATASLVYRPLRPLRVSAGLAYNMISPGVRAGITYVPFGTWFTPTLSLDYGHYKDGNANPLARMVTGDKTIDEPTLQHVGYDFFNAHVGLEFGRKWFTFYIHAGMSRVTGTVHNLDATIAANTNTAHSSTSSSSSTSVSFTKDPDITLWAPSAQLGFVIYLSR